jgi:hypothetical protein
VRGAALSQRIATGWLDASDHIAAIHAGLLRHDAADLQVYRVRADSH